MTSESRIRACMGHNHGEHYSSLVTGSPVGHHLSLIHDRNLAASKPGSQSGELIFGTVHEAVESRPSQKVTARYVHRPYRDVSR